MIALTYFHHTSLKKKRPQISVGSNPSVVLCNTSVTDYIGALNGLSLSRCSLDGFLIQQCCCDGVLRVSTQEIQCSQRAVNQMFITGTSAVSADNNMSVVLKWCRQCVVDSRVSRWKLLCGFGTVGANLTLRSNLTRCFVPLRDTKRGRERGLDRCRC